MVPGSIRKPRSGLGSSLVFSQVSSEAYEFSSLVGQISGKWHPDVFLLWPHFFDFFSFLFLLPFPLSLCCDKSQGTLYTLSYGTCQVTAHFEN